MGYRFTTMTFRKRHFSDLLPMKTSEFEDFMTRACAKFSEDIPGGDVDDITFYAEGARIVATWDAPDA